MRIAFLTLEYPPKGGGIASSLGSLAPALAERGHEVRVVGWSDSGHIGEVDGVTVELEARTQLPKLGWWVNPRRVEQRMRRLAAQEPEVVVAHDWCGPSAGMRFPCPVAVWCHGSATYFSVMTGEELRPRVRRAEQRALRSAVSVAAVSRFTAAKTQELFGLPDTPKWVPNPVDVARFEPAQPDQVNAKSFLYSGTVVRKKGVLELCRAFNLVVEQEPTAELIVAGRDSRDAKSGAESTWELCEEELSADARTRVRRLGFVPYQEMNQLTRSCLAAVLPSRAEALPLAWMEVMASGRPVIGADIGWAPELIQSGVDGLLSPPRDTEVLAEHMLRLLRDPELAQELGAAARRRMVESFSKSVVAEQFERWLIEAVNS